MALFSLGRKGMLSDPIKPTGDYHPTGRKHQVSYSFIEGYVFTSNFPK